MGDASTILILLAAGTGSRMLMLVAQCPKALLPIDAGRSVAEMTIENLMRADGGAAVLLVGGYKYEVVENFVRDHPLSARIVSRYNPEFATAGPIRSIDVALQEIGAAPE